MVLSIKCDAKEEKKRVKRWAKLGFDYYQIKEAFESLHELENNLNKAIGICDENTQKLKEKKEQVNNLYKFLATHETVK